MKQQVSPAVAAIAILLIVGVAALAFLRFGGVSHNQPAPPGMPESVQKQWQAIAGGAVPGKSGTSGPQGTGTIPGVGQMSGRGGPPVGMPGYAAGNMGGIPPPGSSNR